MIHRLIGYDTTSRDSNLALIDWVKSYLAGHGIESRITYDDQRKKANLFATLGPARNEGGIVLSGHTDVVPVDGQPWVTDPFKVVEKDGKLFGRGTCDMKSFVAIVLALVPEFIRRKPTQPIHVALSYDEEVGCIGVQRLIADLGQAGIRPAACIVGEPTCMKLVIAHKGKKSWRCRVRGLECHSSLAPQGVNAVEAACEVVAYLKGMARRHRDLGPFNRDFDIPHTTVHTGVIHGGTALNIVPLDCHFDFEFRYLPGTDVDALFAEVRQFAETKLLPEMRAVHADSGFTWEDLSEIPGLAMDENDAVVELGKALTGANSVAKVAFGTEAGRFQEAGIPTIICGPGDIEQAHKPNEFVSLDHLAQCETFLHRLMDRVCAGSENQDVSS
ncbi:MAG: acetylornithine deacetylase [Alphaproteobacteria bacterium]|nr:acetylornithine deacetylase [Alphaproteobacteria bacterium]